MSGNCDLYGPINIAVSSVTSALCVLLLVVFYTRLSRKIDNHTCSNQANGSTYPKPEQPNASLAGPEVLQKPSIRGVSESSSDSSDSSDSSPSTKQVMQLHQPHYYHHHPGAHVDHKPGLVLILLNDTIRIPETRLPKSSTPSNMCPVSEQGIDYTTLVFQGPGCSTSVSGDYENMRMATDYVNVDPQKRKVDFWTCSSPVESKPAEYTEVKL